MIAASPETATGLGLDKDARADLKSKLSDVSRGALAADQRACYGMLRRMWAVDPASLSAPERTRYAAVQYALRLGAQGGDFHYGDNTFRAAMNENATPYVVSQQTGAMVGIPEFLNSQHQIETPADCEAYLSRLDAFARQLDQESERVRHDMANGVIAPDFILDTALTQARAFRATPAGESGMVHSLASRAAEKHIDGDDYRTIASGEHGWENHLENGLWTYPLEEVWSGLQDAYATHQDSCTSRVILATPAQ